MATILITGASKGIGFEAALAFARAGHKVFATMRNPQQSPALAEIAAGEALPIAISQIDVDSDESVRDGIANLLAHGPVDVLVNNAGVEIADSGTWLLRHPVGPDALPLIAWRKQMTDEEWVEVNAADDATFFATLGG